MGKFNTKIVGVTQQNKDGGCRQALIEAYARDGQKLTLLREPENRYDSNATAVGVLVNGKFKQYGYLSQELAEEIANHLDRGKAATATITNVTGGTKNKNFGVNIEINKLQETDPQGFIPDDIAETDSHNIIRIILLIVGAVLIFKDITALGIAAVALALISFLNKS